MKKRISVGMALLLCLCIMTSTAFAEDLETEAVDGTESEVALTTESESKINVQSAVEDQTCSIDVDWGDLEFTCVRTWNPETLSYEADGEWTPESASVKVTNTSDVPVLVSMNLVNTGKYDISANIDSETLVLNARASDEFKVSVTGSPTEELAEQQSNAIATLTITVSATEID